MKTILIIIMIISGLMILAGLASIGRKKRSSQKRPEITYVSIVPSVFDLFRRK